MTTTNGTEFVDKDRPLKCTKIPPLQCLSRIEKENQSYCKLRLNAIFNGKIYKILIFLS